MSDNAGKLWCDETECFHHLTYYKECSHISEGVGKLYSRIINMYTNIMDAFFLRRLLDKEYITNSITYTGMAHSTNYINFLVSEFYFKVTHASYSKEQNVDQLNKKIKNSSYAQVRELFYPPAIHQCSDMSSFHDSFL